MVKGDKRESVVIVKPKKEQGSKEIKKMIKDKIDIKNLAIGITKIKNGEKGSLILGCKNEKEIRKLKDRMKEKLGNEVDIFEPKKSKPKLKITNISKDIMKLSDDNIIDTIIKENEIEDKREGNT